MAEHVAVIVAGRGAAGLTAALACALAGVTDPDGQVPGPAGHALDGIYAAGNAAAFWTADGYPGPGVTLGIGMTLGYRAACAITGSAAPVHAG